MAEAENADQTQLIQEDVDPIIAKEVDGILGGKPFDENQVQHYINLICEKIMKGLLDLGKPYKFIVNCTIMQKNGAGLIQSTSSYWDTLADLFVTYQWPNKKDTVNKTMICIVNVYGIMM